MTREARIGGIAALVALCAALACDRPAPPFADGDTAAKSAPIAPPRATEVVRLAPDRDELRERASRVFGTLPSEVTNPAHPVTDAQVALGRVLYYDTRLSKNHEIACNSCHPLDRFGADGEPTSPGHRGQRGARNAPTVYNAALSLAQFWDGRAADVEQVAVQHVLNPIEMAMPSEAALVAVLESIPGYAPLFAVAFPDTGKPISDDNVARAIGAFERRLLAPSPFDAFLAGDVLALGDAQVRGLETFLDTGCTTCHQGAGIGGGLYQKLGVVRPFPTADPGRAAVTGNEAERHFFKVPSLRNAAVTAPYFHDGSVATLGEAIRIMAAVQLGQDLADDRIAGIRAFLESLTGAIVDPAWIAHPALPESGPETPAPDPS
jgi:cytochrome c peroxidase